MPAANPTYNLPGVSFTSLASQSVTPGPGAAGVLCLIGTAPKGTNQPKLFTSLADVQNNYGNAVQSGNSFNLEPAMEIAFAQTNSAGGLQVYGIRAGATQAVASVPNGDAGFAFTLTAAPAYAGNNNMQVVVSASTYNSGVGSYQQTLSLYDNTVGQQIILEQYTDYSPQQIANDINQTSQLMTATSPSGGVGTVSNNFGTAGTYTLTGAQNGANAQPSDYINAINQLAVNINCDFIVALNSDSSVMSALKAHVDAMATINQPREAILGVSYMAQPKAVVQAQAISNASLFGSDKYVTLLANSGGMRIDPTNNKLRVWDGFYMAAGLGAIKAAANPAEPLTRKSLTGFSDLSEYFSSSDLLAFGQVGVIALTNNPAPVHVVDGLTLADYPSNYRKENIVAQENRLTKILYTFVNPLIGTANPVNNVQAILQAIIDGLNFASSQQIIRGFDQSAVTVTPTSPGSTTGQYRASVSYRPRLEIDNINFFLTLDLSI